VTSYKQPPTPPSHVGKHVLTSRFEQNSAFATAGDDDTTSFVIR